MSESCVICSGTPAEMRQLVGVWVRLCQIHIDRFWPPRETLADRVRALPGSGCECAAWTVEAGWHSPDCHWEAVEEFRNRVLALLTVPSAGPPIAGAGRVSELTAGGTLDGSAEAIVAARQAT
jgi:hypothetical protein